jgi:hypothetical protein
MPRTAYRNACQRLERLVNEVDYTSYSYNMRFIFWNFRYEIEMVVKASKNSSFFVSAYLFDGESNGYEFELCYEDAEPRELAVLNDEHR